MHYSLQQEILQRSYLLLVLMVTKANADANMTVKPPVTITTKGETSIPENKSFMIRRVFYDNDLML
jgi:hypothetical protein